MNDTEIKTLIVTNEDGKINQVTVNYSKKWIAQTASSRASDVEIIVSGPTGVKRRILLALVGD